MKKFILFIIFFVCISLCPAAYSQQYNFVNYSVGDGLPQSQIYAMYQDEQSYLWFGTYGGGLCRYDGYNFVIFNEENGLKCNFIRCIAGYNDKEKYILVGTDNGLYVYNGKTFNLFYNKAFPSMMSIRAISIDRNNDVWVGTASNGVYKYHKGNIEHFTEKEGLLSNNISCVYNDKNNDTWIGDEKGFAKIHNGKITSYSNVCKYSFAAVRAITEDNKGNLWLGSYGDGVCSYNGKQFTRYTVNNGLCNNTVLSILSDNNGELWFGTAIGVSKFNGSAFTTITTDEGLCSNVITTLLKDSENNIWFGSSGGGVSRYDNERFIYFPENDKMGKLVYAIAQDNENNIWFATSNGGISKYNGKTFSLIKGSAGFTSEKIKTIYCEKNGDIWFGTIGKGAFCYHNGQYIHYYFQKGLCGNFISSITSDINGNIWFSSLDRGIGVYNKSEKKFYRYTVKDGLCENRTNIVCADKYGNIWAGHANKGLSRITVKNYDYKNVAISTFTTKQGLSGNSINSVIVKDDDIYIGTLGEGISVIHKNGKVAVISKKNGITSNVIYSLLFDALNQLWIGSEKGIDKVVLKNDSIIKVNHYNKNNGFKGVETTLNSSYIDKQGMIWFGTVNGAIKYDHAYDHMNISAPVVHITGVNLFFDKIENTEFANAENTIDEISAKLILPYNKNHLSFNFIGINFRNPEAVKYKWKLEGFDKDWSPQLTKLEATYSNLPPGKYIFNVMAYNEDGVCSITPAKFAFTIRPPFWATAWFIVSAIIFLVLLLWLIVSSLNKRFRQRNQEMQQRVALQKNILELQQATSRLQMNPHFIFNSLNSIQGYIAENNTTMAKWYLSKFAKLIRMILDNAREEFISLNDEIIVLENYLALEKMRMNDKFNFEINIADKIDKDAIEIPPMLIQPFVENAVLHGLKHKKGQGNLEIKITEKDNILFCEIVDDGIGRESAIELKNKSASEHKSSAIAITEERLKRLSDETNRNASLKIVDLKDESGKSSGTKVIIEIPI